MVDILNAANSKTKETMAPSTCHATHFLSDNCSR